jgi:hypothetical protein
MAKQTLLYFVKDANEMIALPARNFIGAECESTNTLGVSFREEDGTAGPVRIILNVDTTGSSLKEAANVLASALAGRSRSLTVVSDSVNGKHLYPFTSIASIS